MIDIRYGFDAYYTGRWSLGFALQPVGIIARPLAEIRAEEYNWVGSGSRLDRVSNVRFNWNTPVGLPLTSLSP